MHTETARSGQTETPNLEDDVDLHFVTFVEHDGFLIELDGSRNSPVNHGKINKGLLEVSWSHCRTPVAARAVLETILT